MRTLGLLVICAVAWPAGAVDRLELRPGDHICYIGNTLAERMQHHGALESMLHGQFPEHQLVVRNLGFSGDELTVRLRSEGFGTPDDWLGRCKADVVFAFFGYNESFAGEAGLLKFRTDLARFITTTLAQKYNGRSSPRLVLFSPIRHENLGNRDLPDGVVNNIRLERYTAAMAEVARAHAVPFVDLFHLPASPNGPPLTINGIHLNDRGDRVVAAHAFNRLFGRHGPWSDAVSAAVRDKNAIWFHRYRTVDGYSIYGGRADLKFTNDQTNRVVMQREMDVLDAMTAIRDRAVWAAARGKKIHPDDSNLPPFIPVITNKPGRGPGGSHVFLGGDEAIKQMTVANGLKVNLFASEEMFPEMVNPVQMAWDARGRLWVAVWPTYPHWKPTEPMNDKILILEDADGDGRADTCTTFAGGLHCPTGFALLHDGALVAQAPDVWMLRDTDGDGKADVRERVLHGIDSADTHHAANSFAVGPDGSVYFQEGTFHHTQVETPCGPPVRNVNAGVYRYEPRTGKFETYVAYGFANPHGHAFDRWGRDIVVDGTGSEPYDAALFSGRLDFPRKHPQPPRVYQPRTRPCPGIEFVSSRHWPPTWQGNLLVANVIGFQGILRYRIDERGASLSGTEQEPVLSSTDANFRPSDLKFGPDGALYFLDWHNPIIGHMQHNLRDPSRDRTHGRVYRVACDGRPLSRQPPIAGRPVEELVKLLAEPEDRVREWVRMELAGRPAREVAHALGWWAASLDKNDPQFEHHLLECLWALRHHNLGNPPLLKRLLSAADPRARSAAVRVLSHSLRQVPGAIELLRGATGDPHPRVRLEVARAASFHPDASAAEIALAAGTGCEDECVTFVVKETLRHFEPTIRAEVARREPPSFESAPGQRYLLRLTDLSQLRAMTTDAAARELLERPAVPDEVRMSALNGLTARRGAPAVVEVLAAIDAGDRDAGVALELARLLAARKLEGWADLDAEVTRLAVHARRLAVRQACWIMLVNADSSAERAWNSARRANALADFLHAVPLFADAGVRAKLYPQIEALLTGEPAQVRDAAMLALPSFRGEEEKAFVTLARHVGEPAAVKALQRIPRANWPAERVAPLATALVTKLQQTPPAGRNTPAARDAMQLADALAAALPAAEARPIRAALAELGVRLIRIGTVPERMAYDQEVVAVRAGKPVEIAFENTDAMPHNLVVTRPGSLEAIGTAAEASAAEPDAANRHYVPRSPQVLLASRLLAPGERQNLTFAAPAEPGVYPIVCTYPGHWRRMYGALYVVADLDAYQADPVAYLAAHRLIIRDELLKDRRPRTEWTFEELRPAVATLAAGPSFASGKHLFGVATCISCHKMEGVGQEFGPDLTQTDAKLTPAELLRELIEPSHRLNEKYVSTRFETAEGRTITGLVVEETADVVKVVENPLLKAEPVVLKKLEIESRERSPVSLMPKGLLDKLTRDEVLDLLAYVVARGNRDHEVFRTPNGAGHRH
jgi:putative heme-binding domain-containing protein